MIRILYVRCTYVGWPDGYLSTTSVWKDIWAQACKGFHNIIVIGSSVRIAWRTLTHYWVHRIVYIVLVRCQNFVICTF